MKSFSISQVQSHTNTMNLSRSLLFAVLFVLTASNTVRAQAPAIILQPNNFAGTNGATAYFSVFATGTDPLSYQWRKNGTNLVDGGGVANSATSYMTLTGISPADAGNYDVVVTNNSGSVTSLVAVLKVVPQPPAGPPPNDSFTNATVIPVSNDVVQVSGYNYGATWERGEPFNWPGFGTFSSVWYGWTPTNSGSVSIITTYDQRSMVTAAYTGSVLSNLTQLTYSPDDANPTNHYVSQFSLIVTAGTTYHFAVDGYSQCYFTLAIGPVLPLPQIITPPQSQLTSPGATVVLSVNATSAASYQWQFNGTNILGAVGPTLTLTNVTAANAGNYHVIVTSAGGSITSTDAEVMLFGDLQMFVGAILAGSVGQQFRVDYADMVNPGSTNWAVLTNVTLPYSPFLVIDSGSPGRTKRFYRAVSLP